MPARGAHRPLHTGRRLADRAAGLAEEIAGLIVAAVVVYAALHINAGH